MNKPKIALLLGGISAEREVSLKTGEEIGKALDKEKYEVTFYDPRDDLLSLCQYIDQGDVDLVIPALHGPFGEDGRIQGMLDMWKIPYLFSGCLASAVAMNKEWSKKIVNEEGVPIIKGKKLQRKDNIGKNIKDISFPLVIKPVELGSSVGINIVKKEEELKEAIEQAFHYDDNILVEEYVKGRELTVTVMGRKEPQALPVIEIIPKKSEWFDFQAKYEPGATDEICPADIPENIKERIQEQAVKAFQVLGCRDVARVDFIWEENEDIIYFLEINTIPGMTSTSLVPQAAQAAGKSFSQFLDELIEGALK